MALTKIMNRNTKAFLQTFAMAFVAVSALLLFMWALGGTLEKNDSIKCAKLEKQAKEFVLWYATDNERAMCEQLNMPLPPNRAEHEVN